MAVLAFITNTQNGIDVIDTSTNTVIATISVGAMTQGVSVNNPSATTKVYTTGSNGVAIVDPCTNTSSILNFGVTTFGVAVSNSLDRVYVTDPSTGDVTVIDANTDLILTTIDLSPAEPAGIVISPDGNTAYVVDQFFGTDSVIVIDLLTNTVTNTILLPAFSTPQGIAITPDGLKLYVTRLSDNRVSVIDTTTETVIATIVVGNSPFGVAANPTQSLVYVTNLSGASVSVIDTTTDTVIDTIAVGTNPRGVSFTLDGLFAYVANQGSDTVSVIDVNTATVTDTVTVGNAPYSFGSFIGNVVCGPFDDLIVTKSFSPSSIELGGTSTLTITVENPNDIDINNVSFNDVYPAGLINATPANASADIGTAVATDGGNSISWSIAVLPANTTATITVEVTTTNSGFFNNSTGAVIGDEASSLGGASATLVVTGNGGNGGRRKRRGTLPTSFCVNKIDIYGRRVNCPEEYFRGNFQYKKTYEDSLRCCYTLIK